MKFPPVKITNTWAYILTKKLNFVTSKKFSQSWRNIAATLYKLRETLNECQLVQYIRSYVSRIVHYGVLLYGVGAETRAAENPTNSICLTRFPSLGQRSREIQ